MDIPVLKRLLAANDAVADQNARRLAQWKIFTVNLIGAPGCGKTKLLEASLERLRGKPRAAVIEGDIRTSLDAERLSGYETPVVQINTEPFGGDCHLEATAISGALDMIDLAKTDLLFIENVGNLVCPAEFKVGEDAKVVALSVTEGEDKPLKYPLAFRESELLVITKIDLVEHLEIDLDRIEANARQIHPAIEVLRVSAKTGEGIDRWLSWVFGRLSKKRPEA
ncbi:MAG: hydrogenase nickel incorporation protein HypB [Candidatus Riflebacteria bacterium]|nr:hydrogenase nickel incorporation protein HypB [Candidatus Riflebacteria bacterium]